MTARQRDVLANLKHFTDEADRYKWHPMWARPMDVGGFNGSHHGATLLRLKQMGLAEVQSWGGGIHSSRRTLKYRITEAGRSELEGPNR